mgnify:CR=1 FL=1
MSITTFSGAAVTLKASGTSRLNVNSAEVVYISCTGDAETLVTVVAAAATDVLQSFRLNRNESIIFTKASTDRVSVSADDDAVATKVIKVTPHRNAGA